MGVKSSVTKQTRNVERRLFDYFKEGCLQQCLQQAYLCMSFSDYIMTCQSEAADVMVSNHDPDSPLKAKMEAYPCAESFH